MRFALRRVVSHNWGLVSNPGCRVVIVVVVWWRCNWVVTDWSFYWRVPVDFLRVAIASLGMYRGAFWSLVGMGAPVYLFRVDLAFGTATSEPHGTHAKKIVVPTGPELVRAVAFSTAVVLDFSTFLDEGFWQAHAFHRGIGVVRGTSDDSGLAGNARNVHVTAATNGVQAVHPGTTEAGYRFMELSCRLVRPAGDSPQTTVVIAITRLGIFVMMAGAANLDLPSICVTGCVVLPLAVSAFSVAESAHVSPMTHASVTFLLVSDAMTKAMASSNACTVSSAAVMCTISALARMFKTVRLRLLRTTSLSLLLNLNLNLLLLLLLFLFLLLLLASRMVFLALFLHADLQLLLFLLLAALLLLLRFAATTMVLSTDGMANLEAFLFLLLRLFVGMAAAMMTFSGPGSGSPSMDSSAVLYLDVQLFLLLLLLRVGLVLLLLAVASLVAAARSVMPSAFLDLDTQLLLGVGLVLLFLAVASFVAATAAWSMVSPSLLHLDP
jgi:hypothetical protein